MFSNEIRETVYIALSLILAALVLGVISLAIHLRGDLASVRNHEIAATLQLSAYEEFNAYNDKKLTAEEVIALITKYYDKGIDIYLNAHGDNVLINKETIIDNPEYKTVLYWNGGIDENTGVLMQGRLSDNVRNKNTYWVGIVYDYQDVHTISGPSDISGNYYTDVTGIVILNSSVDN